MTDLIPGSDYHISVQSVLGSDASRAAHRAFSTRETHLYVTETTTPAKLTLYLKAVLSAVPAGLCPLRLADVTSSSFSVTWDAAYGEFDFHRVTVTNASVTTALVIPKEERVAVVTGLVGGCTYNVSVARVRGVTAGSAASLRVSTGNSYRRSTRSLSPLLAASNLNILVLLIPSSPVFSAGRRARHAYF